MFQVSSAEWLRIHRVIVRFVLAAANIFAWILAFQYVYSLSGHLGSSLAQIVLLYALTQSIVALVTPYSASIVHLGLRKGMVYGLLFASVGYLCLGATLEGVTYGYVSMAGLVGFALSIGLFRALYWIPYMTEAHEHEVDVQPHRPQMWYEFPIIVSPLLAGLIIGFGGLVPAWTMYAASALMILAVFPLLGVREVYESFPWRRNEILGMLFDHRHIMLLRRSFLDGVQTTALLLLWPITVLLLVGWSYPMVGLVIAITALVVLFTQKRVHSLLARTRMQDSFFVHSVVILTAWVGRLVIASPFTIIVIDSYYRMGMPTHLGIDIYAHEHAADGGVLVDELSVLKEIGLALGRIAMCILTAALALTTSFPLALACAFAVAAIAGIVSLYLARYARRI